jgi:hypothetical protein
LYTAVNGLRNLPDNDIASKIAIAGIEQHARGPARGTDIDYGGFGKDAATMPYTGSAYQLIKDKDELQMRYSDNYDDIGYYVPVVYESTEGNKPMVIMRDRNGNYHRVIGDPDWDTVAKDGNNRRMRLNSFNTF